MKNLFTVVLILLLLFRFGETYAQTQEVAITPIPGASGLTLGKINDMVQDKYGFMWFIDQTNQYLVRYDGSTMKRYTYDETNPDNPNSLGGVSLESLFADDDGIIWIGGVGRIDRLDPLTDTFTHYRHIPNDSSSLSEGFVSALLVDHLGKVWAGTSAGLDRLDQETGKFTHFRHDPEDTESLSDNMVRSLYEDREGTLWAGTGWEYAPDEKGGLNKLNRASGTFTRYLHDVGNPHSLNNNKIRSLFEDSKDNFWIGTWGGLHRMDRESGEFQRMAEDPGTQEKSILGGLVTSISEDKENRLWIGTLQGKIGSYDPDTKLLIDYNITSIWKIVASKDGHIWVSTEKDFRLYKLDPYHTRIESSDEELHAWYQESPTVVWKGSINGLVRVDIQSGKEIKFTNNPKDEHSLSNNEVSAIAKDHLGSIWVGTGNGLNRYNPATNNFTRYLDKPKTQEEGWRSIIASIYEDSQHNLWVGTYFGLGKYNRAADQFSWTNMKENLFTMLTNNSDTLGISSNQVMQIREDANKALWIGTLKGGVNRFDPNTRKFRHYLAGSTAWQMLIDKDNVIWAGTWSGLYFYNPITDRFERHAIEEGISSLIEDDSGNLWVTAARGLYKIDPNREQYVLYGPESGMIAQEAMGPSFKALSGEITFTRREGGYYSLDPEKLYVRKDTAKLYFTNFWVGNEPLSTFTKGPLSGPPLIAKSLKLKHNQNIFSISFTKVDFRADTDEEIFYFLENYDQEWRAASPEEKISYSMVPPGEYTFRIKSATNGNGIWVEKEVPITILPPWYMTWWAFGFYGLMFVGSLAGVDRVQRKRIIDKERALAKEKELAQAKEIKKAYDELGVAHTNLKSTQSQLIQSEKMASLGELTAGIAHEIQNPLNFVNNFSEVSNELIDEMNEEIEKGDLKEAKAIADDIKQNLEKINHHGKRADSIVKGMLQHSRSSSGVKEPTDINALADEYLRLAYHGLRAKDKSFNAKFETTFEEGIGKVNVIPQDIGRVILNLITNAFYACAERSRSVVNERKKLEQKGYEPMVTVSTKKEGDKVIVTVQDNGNGIPDSVKKKIFQPFFTTKPTGQGTGLGLSMSYDIVTKGHGGELKVKSEEGKGTTFTISLPLDQKT